VTADSAVIEPSVIEAALAQRLRAVCEILLDAPAPAPDSDPARDASIVLDLLVQTVHAAPSPDRIWLLYTAVSGALPNTDDVLEGVRLFQLVGVSEATLWLLDRAFDTDAPDAATNEMRVVTDQVVVDVDHTARHDLHTGIQQVVRRTTPLWVRDHDVLPVAWTQVGRAMRTLSDRETRRALQWGLAAPDDATEADAPAVVVPWRTVVVLAETPSRVACERLAALAQFSGNAVVAVGYDCIPAVSADLIPSDESDRFARYLTVIKHAHRVAGISETASAEFRGFAEALPPQGLSGPAVVECALPAEHIQSEESPADTRRNGTFERPPLVLSVGSLEPRKNHLAILYAAERLWREGLQFELLFIGGSGWGADTPRQIEQLGKRGRPLSVRKGVSDGDVAAAYRWARFTVFVSVHEGYGLPVAESLSFGTPVITGNYGATREIGVEGGTVLIDPRDDEALVGAMRGLLIDDAQVESLRKAIEVRPARTWAQYAADLWDCLVQPELDVASAGEP
jgi:glycosyltransferase involved in cell wall biosynthesis